MGSRKNMLLLFAICLVAGSIRLLYLGHWADNPLFLMPFGDEHHFHLTALGLLGQTAQPDSFLYQPLYSFYLAALYWLFGIDVVMVRGVQLVLGVLNVFLFYLLGRELGGIRVGLLSAGLAAGYGPFVFFESQMLAPVLTVPLVTGSCLCFLKAWQQPSQRNWLLLPGSVCLGLALMARPNAAIILLPAGLYWWSNTFRGKKNVRAGVLGVVWVVVGLALGMSPSWIHNARQGLGTIPVSASTGHSFYLGNNPKATGAYHVPKGEQIDASSHSAYRESLRLIAEKELGRTLSLDKVSSFWFSKGIDFWLSSPSQALGLWLTKLALGIQSREVPIHYTYTTVENVIPLLGYLLSFGIVFAFAVTGVCLARHQRSVMLLFTCAIVYLVGLSLFYIADRYRILAVPMLMPLSALGIVGLYDMLRTQTDRWKKIGCMALPLVAFAITWRPSLPADQTTQDSYRFHNLMGKAAGDLGNIDKAQALFQKAIRIAGPQHGAVARSNLAIIDEQQGRIAQAIKRYEKAARIASQNRFVRRRLAELYEKNGDLESALHFWRQLEKLEADPSFVQHQIRRIRSALDCKNLDTSTASRP